MNYITLLPITIALYSRFLITNKKKSGFIFEIVSCTMFMIYYVLVLHDYFLALFMLAYAILAVIGFISWTNKNKPAGTVLSDYYISHDPIPQGE